MASSTAATAVTATITTLTPPSSSHGSSYEWKMNPYSISRDDSMPSNKSSQATHHFDESRGPLTVHNGNAFRDPFPKRNAADMEGEQDEEILPNIRRTSYADDKRGSMVMKDENAGWIHRDKLVRIENAELQAAGIVLPKTRSVSKPPRRERSTDNVNSHRRAMESGSSEFQQQQQQQQQQQSRSRKNSAQTTTTTSARTSSTQAMGTIATTPTTETDQPSWDLRLPEEIAEDLGEYFVPNNPAGPKGSRIPVAKISPAPVPVDYVERDAPVPRKSSGSLLPPDDDFTLARKSRSRSNSIPVLDTTPPRVDAPRNHSARRAPADGSPKKQIHNGRKVSATPSGKTSTRPKTRGGRDGSVSARPSTRSGELSPTNKTAPEGDPPWTSAFKPDPRLPPDQQLLPTVARRLQQEKWEKEGKFGNIYDTEFRPLNEQDPNNKPPELGLPELEIPQSEQENQQDEWPLRTNAEAKSPTQSRPGTSSYTTMPRVQNKNSAGSNQQRSPSVSQPTGSAQPTQITRVPDPPEEDEKTAMKKEKSCACCVVM